MRFSYLFPIFLMMYEFCAYMSNDMYMPAFPVIAGEFGVDDGLVQATLTAWLLGGASAQLLLGPLSDRIGRRPVLLGGGVLFLLSCIACAFAPNIFVMMCARFIQGIAVCSMMIAGYATIHESYEEERAVSLLAMLSTVSVTAPMIGPLAGGIVLLYWDWRMIFLVIFMLASLAIGSLFFLMPESNQNKNTSAFSLKNLYSEYRVVLKNTKFLRHALMFGLLYGGIMLWIATSPFLLMETNGLDARQFGLAQVPIFGSFIIGSQIVRLLVKRLKLKTLAITGITIALIGTIISMIASFYGDNMLLIIIGSVMIFALGFGLASAPLNRLAFNSSRADKGILTSMFYTCSMTVGSAGTVLISILYDGHLMSYAACMVAMMLIAITLFISIYWEKKYI